MRSSNVVAICAVAWVLAACGSTKSPSSSVDSGTPLGNTAGGTAWCTNGDNDVVRIVDLAKGSFTEVDLSSQHLSPLAIALNSTDAWVIAAANENTNNSTINVVQISRATHKFVTTFPLDSDGGLNTSSIVATDSAVWISGSSGGPVLYKIDATSTPTGYAVKASVGVASQTSNSVLVGSGSIWLLVSNNSEILKINPSNPTSTPADLLVGNGIPEFGALAMDATNLYVIDGFGHLYSVPQNGFPNVTPSAPSTGTFFTPIRVGSDGLYVLPADRSKQISVVDKTKLTVTRTVPADDVISTFAVSGNTVAAAVGEFGGDDLQVFDASSGATVAKIPGVYADTLVLE